jgi:chorismate dehydratase
LPPKINQLDKIKVGIVNYLNTIPLLYGINKSPVRDSVELLFDYPSNIASFLIDGKIDIGLVPVAILPRLNEYHIHTEYCIGCNGPIASVCVFSEVPIENIETILLDYQSRTSVALLKILLRDYWQVTPRLVDTASDYRSSIRESTAGLVIGDRSFEQRQKSKYVYDLGDAWKKHTGLPFVFATWTSTRQLDQNFILEFDKANARGIQNIPHIIDTVPYTLFDMKEYFTKYISYKLDHEKRQGLSHFLKLLKAEIK